MEWLGTANGVSSYRGGGNGTCGGRLRGLETSSGLHVRFRYLFFDVFVGLWLSFRMVGELNHVKNMFYILCSISMGYFTY